MKTWDIMICSIPHRDRTMTELLAELDTQTRRGVGVIAFRDNLETQYGSKIAQMLDHSKADYVSCIDDDDMVAPDFIRRIHAALQEDPDYVGFPVRYTRDGDLQKPVHHSLRYHVWEDREEALVRDITQFNPIRRELALLGEWYAAERRWADGVRASGRCVKEVWIDDPMYYYRHNTSDFFQTARQPYPPGSYPRLPEYPWLTVLEP
jgi:glycosyltransferase involved in cell wall biosynthesis